MNAQRKLNKVLTVGICFSLLLLAIPVQADPYSVFDGSVTLSPGTFAVTAYNSGLTYTVNNYTPLGALNAAAQLASFGYNVTDKKYSSMGILLLDEIDGYWYTDTATWICQVNGVTLDDFHYPTTDGLNIKQIFDGDQVDFYYGLKPVTPENAIAAVKIYVAPTAAPGWYFKPGYTNYAPSGMPDFDQKQDNWVNLQTQQWSFCGPTAVANCFWWFDSKYEDPTGVPGDGRDTFPLVSYYQPPTYLWGPDDHDPNNVDDLGTPWPPGNELIEQLAWCMDTDGVRTGIPHSGTDVHVMELCIDNWLIATGLDDVLFEHTVPKPDFSYIEEEIKRCQDVILLLGFWQEVVPGYYERVGGHYVTVAGVDSENLTIAFSDPFIDNAEAGGPGRVPVPHPPYPHGATVHNDAQLVSHDFYAVLPGSPSPGGFWWIPDYPVNQYPDMIWNFQGQNCPPEFVGQQGTYLPGPPIHTEIEYAVIISPLPPTPFLIRGWVNCTDGEPINDPSVTVTNVRTGTVFIAETSPDSNYYQVLTSSDEVMAGDVLHFNASNSNSIEFDHTVTAAELCEGGFEQNITIVCVGGLCGDVNNDGKLTMGDGRLVYLNVIYGDVAYPLANPWAADVNCDEKRTMGDGRLVYLNVIYGDVAYPLHCCP